MKFVRNRVMGCGAFDCGGVELFWGVGGGRGRSFQWGVIDRFVWRRCLMFLIFLFCEGVFFWECFEI